MTLASDNRDFVQLDELHENTDAWIRACLKVSTATNMCVCRAMVEAVSKLISRSGIRILLFLKKNMLLFCPI